jgi:hypothetical protein
MSEHLDRLLSAVVLVCRASEDCGRAERVLEAALRALVNPASTPSEIDRRTDALGAPLVPGRAAWEELRLAVRAVATDIGWEAAARRYGGDPQALKDTVYRQRLPGAGRQARLLQVVAGTEHVTGNLPDRRAG